PGNTPIGRGVDAGALFLAELGVVGETVASVLQLFCPLGRRYLAAGAENDPGLLVTLALVHLGALGIGALRHVDLAMVVALEGEGPGPRPGATSFRRRAAASFSGTALRVALVTLVHDDDPLGPLLDLGVAFGMGMGDAGAAEARADSGEHEDGSGGAEQAQSAGAVVVHHFQSPFQLVGVIERAGGNQAGAARGFDQGTGIFVPRLRIGAGGDRGVARPPLVFAGRTEK